MPTNRESNRKRRLIPDPDHAVDRKMQKACFFAGLRALHFSTGRLMAVDNPLLQPPPVTRQGLHVPLQE